MIGSPRLENPGQDHVTITFIRSGKDTEDPDRNLVTLSKTIVPEVTSPTSLEALPERSDVNHADDSGCGDKKVQNKKDLCTITDTIHNLGLNYTIESLEQVKNSDTIRTAKLDTRDETTDQSMSSVKMDLNLQADGTVASSQVPPFTPNPDEPADWFFLSTPGSAGFTSSNADLSTNNPAATSSQIPHIPSTDDLEAIATNVDDFLRCFQCGWSTNDNVLYVTHIFRRHRLMTCSLCQKNREAPISTASLKNPGVSAEQHSTGRLTCTSRLSTW